jgi:hypothetical protein
MMSLEEVDQEMENFEVQLKIPKFKNPKIGILSLGNFNPI